MGVGVGVCVKSLIQSVFRILPKGLGLPTNSKEEKIFLTDNPKWNIESIL